MTTNPGRSWRRTLELPNKVRVRGRGVANAPPAGLEPQFGLYLGVDYHPDWEYEILDWPDFRLPRDPADAAVAIEEAYRRACDGERVEVACRAGRGRTGTVLACMAVLAGMKADHAVGWVRRHYDARAVETPWQARWVRRFPALLDASS